MWSVSWKYTVSGIRSGDFACISWQRYGDDDSMESEGVENSKDAESGYSSDERKISI